MQRPDARQFDLCPSLVSYGAMPLEEANAALERWGHKMGPIRRPMGLQEAHGLTIGSELVGVTVTADLICQRVASLGRDEAVELARVCAVQRDVCRVLVRLWRLAVLPCIARHRGRALTGLSYQDAILHGGDLYRFDGWTAVARSRSGTDPRSGRKGRSKVIWSFGPVAPA